MQLGLESYSTRNSGLDPVGVLELASELGLDGVLFELSPFSSFRAEDLRPIRATAAVIAGAQLHVDIEGGLVYVARAGGTRSVVFFGPTPVATFGFPDNVNVCMERCRPCWWSREGWGAECPKGHAHCRNMPDPAQAAEVVTRALEEMELCASPS